MAETSKAFHDPLREAHEFRDQVGSEGRRLAFFFGAGTSQAAGIDGIAGLTEKVGASLSGDQKKHYDRLIAEAGEAGPKTHPSEHRAETPSGHQGQDIGA